MFWEVPSLLIAFIVGFIVSIFFVIKAGLKDSYKMILEEAIREEWKRVPKDKTSDALIYKLNNMDKDYLRILYQCFKDRRRH